MADAPLEIDAGSRGFDFQKQLAGNTAPNHMQDMRNGGSLSEDAITKYRRKEYADAAALFERALESDPDSFVAFRGWLNACRLTAGHCQDIPYFAVTDVAPLNCSAALSDLIELAPDRALFERRLNESGVRLLDVYGHPDTAYQLFVRDYVAATVAFEKLQTRDLASLIVVLSDLIDCTEDEYARSPLYNTEFRERFVGLFPQHIRKAYKGFALRFYEASEQKQQF